MILAYFYPQNICTHLFSVLCVSMTRCFDFRFMMCAGSAMPVPLIHDWYSLTGHILKERYGMTEILTIMSNPLHGERIPGADQCSVELSLCYSANSFFLLPSPFLLFKLSVAQGCKTFRFKLLHLKIVSISQAKINHKMLKQVQYTQCDPQIDPQKRGVYSSVPDMPYPKIIKLKLSPSYSG